MRLSSSWLCSEMRVMFCRLSRYQPSVDSSTPSAPASRVRRSQGGSFGPPLWRWSSHAPRPGSNSRLRIASRLPSDSNCCRPSPDVGK
ncbi:hypothetical protein D3C81_1945780 [compost metagenome]